MIRLIPTLLFALAVTGTLRADDGESTDEPKVTVTARTIVVGQDGKPREQKIELKDSKIVSRVIVLDADGQVRVIGGGDDPDLEKVLDDLPKEAAEALEKAMKRPPNRVFGRAVIIGPDGKRTEIPFGGAENAGNAFPKQLPEHVRKRIEDAMKRARQGAKPGQPRIVIGPNGIMQPHESLPKEINEILERARKQANAKPVRDTDAKPTESKNPQAEIRALRRQLLEIQKRLEKLEAAQ